MFTFPVTLFSQLFLPSDVAGLALWLDASYAASLITTSAGSTQAVSDGDPVGRWEDRSGGARHLTQATSTSRPTLKTAYQNGLNVVLFDGTDDFLQGPTVSLDQYYGASAVTLFFVVRRDSTGNGALLEHGTATANAVRVWSPFSSDGKLYYDHGNYSSGGRISVAAPGGYSDAWHVLECYRESSSSEIVVDGSLQTSGTVTSSLGSLTSTASMYLAKHAVSGSSMYKGHIAEVLVYSASLSSGNRASVRAYLKAKWGTP